LFPFFLIIKLFNLELVEQDKLIDAVGGKKDVIKKSKKRKVK
jgi:hypothetical protein